MNTGGDSGGATRAALAAPEPGKVPRVLTIAGSDSGGGAGIQADLKAFARCGVHGMSAITAVTAQNTVAVEGVWPLPRDAIVAQVRAVVSDIGVDAIKIGMLGTVAIIEAVAEALDLVDSSVPIVVDPVMVAESGARLLAEDAVEALVRRILPRATVTTPNLAEARVLAEHSEHARTACAVGDTGAPARQARRGLRPRPRRDEGEELARSVRTLGPRCVVVTGGHRERAVDTFFDGERVARITGRRWPDGAAHGSGCTHSAALAAYLAWGFDPLGAARRAKRVAARAVRDGLREIGHGAGPVDVFGLAGRRPPAARAKRTPAPQGRGARVSEPA
ncbi:bifunctional hydroxymethylpyrimidine kinase/phosphomethylpyrimidine kinase [Thermoleophilum album]|jgi:hydroxymethylpyrimidine/phosphomethylpyrimidine kinase|uniref:bifunctional hydroxymethylpyrimidine kinase/phosphomethylpyrimidine kinase n=1 Tax=Thermoleophilum album TaxID=29539 RepID=UPI00237D120A|nr:bifunctional hydroxymethylpyrimidine kinase/phosphomethylpyrimidine kinase [Thermoleophilum album]WDT94439.1 bifunctional hydroxymethylpyrimidine kinase/phosphomethylpyrimidine kinase [Thermoleophilum album]